MLQRIRQHTAAGRQNDEGATATEYVLLLAGIAAIIIVAVFAFGGFLSSKFNRTSTAIDTGSVPAAQ